MKFHFHLLLLTLIVYCLYYLFSETQKKNSCSVLQELPSSSSLQRQKWQHFHEIFSQNETHGVVKFSQFKFSKKKNITSINLLLMRKGTHKFTVSSKTNCTLFFREINFTKILWNWFHEKTRKDIATNKHDYYPRSKAIFFWILALFYLVIMYLLLRLSVHSHLIFCYVSFQRCCRKMGEPGEDSKFCNSLNFLCTFSCITFYDILAFAIIVVWLGKCYIHSSC